MVGRERRGGRQRRAGRTESILFIEPELLSDGHQQSIV
jgi:hypothetical protein